MARAGTTIRTLVAVLAAAGTAAGQTADYPALDSFEGSHVYMAQVPRNPICIDNTNNRIYAVNNHDSTVLRFDDLSGQPSKTYLVPWSPVAVELWAEPAGAEYLLVLSAGNDALTMIREDTGEYETVIQPQVGTGERLDGACDLLVDHAGNLAYATFAHSNAVLQIDLVTRTTTNVYEISGSRPTHLSFDLDGKVLVAPLLSGNATAVHQDGGVLSPNKGQLSVIDLDPATSNVLLTGTAGLPDTDIFAIDPVSGTITRAVRDAGTIMFQHEINPATDQLWMLNIECDNLTEGVNNLQGVFASNRLSISASPSTAPTLPIRPTSVIDLDTVISGTATDATSVSMPVALEFAQTGAAAIAGLQSDRVLLLSSSGGLIDQIDLARGSLPRGLAWSPVFSTVYVYCWGTNVIEGWVISTTSPPSKWITLDLGHDPTPENEQAGRATFYDASHSLKGNATCGSCHIDGEQDGRSWDLGKPGDQKGAFVTQTLVGIERTQPFHWRGEQENGLIDFNSAFVDLLGAPKELTPAQFAVFEDFVFSLTPRANPDQAFDRKIHDDIDAPLVLLLSPQVDAKAATLGLSHFNGACGFCHTFPTSTNNDFIKDGEFHPHENKNEVAALTQLQNRANADDDASDFDIDVVQVMFDTAAFSFLPTSAYYNTTGTGLSHAGILQSLHAFVRAFPGTPEEIANVSSVIFQYDEGIAPAVHRAHLLDVAHQAPADIDALYDQAKNPVVTSAGPTVYNCELAVIGTATIATVQQEIGWWYDPASDTFLSEDKNVTADLTFFKNQAAADQGEFVFLGMPVGMGRRFAIDYDGDGLLNFEEGPAGLGTDVYDDDTDGDRLPDGYEVQHSSDPLVSNPGSIESGLPVVSDFEVFWVTARVARLRWTTDEPTTSVVTFTSNASGHTGQVVQDRFATRHSVILPDLEPSEQVSPGVSAVDSVYDIEILATDPSGNANAPGAGEKFDDVLTVLQASGTAGVRVTELTHTQQPIVTAGGVELNVRVRVVDRQPFTMNVGAPGYHVVFHPLIDGVRASSLDTFGLVQDFSVQQGSTTVDYDAAIGQPNAPWAITGVTNNNGFVDYRVEVQGAGATSVVELVVELVGRPGVPNPAYQPVPPVPFLHVPDPHEWSLADTSEPERSIGFNLP